MLGQTLPERYLRVPNLRPQRCHPRVIIIDVIWQTGFCAIPEPFTLIVDKVKETLDSLGSLSKHGIIRILRLDYRPLFNLCG